MPELSKNFFYRLLRRSERYTKTDMVYLARGGAWLGFGQIVSSVLAFLSGLAFANWLSPEEFGIYRYIFTLYGFFSVLSLVEMGTAVIRSVSRGLEGSVLNAVRTKIKWGFLGSLAAIGTALYYWSQGNEMVAWGCIICSLFIPFVDTFSMYEAVQKGRQHFDQATYYRLIGQIINTGLGVLVLALTHNILAVVASYFISWTIIRVYFYLRLLKTHPLQPGNDPEVVHYGKHLSLMKGLGIVTGNISSFFLFQLLGPTSLALYAVAIAPTEQIRRLLGIVENLAMPKMSADDWKLINPLSFFKKIIPFALILITISLCFMIAAPFLYAIFFPQYTSIIWLSQWYAATILLTGVNIILSTILKSKQKIKELHILNGADIFLQLIPTLPLIYWLGIFGLVLSVLITKLIEAIIMLLLLFRSTSLKQPPENLSAIREQ